MNQPEIKSVKTTNAIAKMKVNACQPVDGKPLAKKMTPALLVLVAGLLFAGCADESHDPVVSAPAAAPVISVEVTTAAPPPPGAVIEPAVESSSEPAAKYAALNPEGLEALNTAVAMYGLDENGKKVRIPKDIDQLVKEKFLMFTPVPPKGKKLIINQQTGLIEMVAAR